MDKIYDLLDGQIPGALMDEIMNSVEDWERTEEMEPKTPESIKAHQDKYKDGIWREHSLLELGMWVHLFIKRSAHRTDPAKAAKDVRDAQNHLDMMQAHIDAAVPA